MYALPQPLASNVGSPHPSLRTKILMPKQDLELSCDKCDKFAHVQVISEHFYNNLFQKQQDRLNVFK